jgi:ribonuclease HII
MKLPDIKTELKFFKKGYAQVIGIDEVGMGCLAGPVVVCSVAVTAKFCKENFARLAGIRDSKLLSESQREKFADTLLATPGFRYQLSLCHPATIDRLNIYQAARHAMRRSIGKLAQGDKVYVLVDGNKKIMGLELSQEAIIKGDQKIFTIACASVIAKVYRDRMMVRYAKKYPGYSFEIHKGYGTPAHLASLTRLGPCALHRKSFAPVAQFL